MNRNLFVSQSSVNDCGAACLAMILNINGRKVTLSDIKNDILIDNEGVSAYEIVKLSSKYKVNAEGYKNADLESLKLPVIAHVINENGLQHFVVLLKVLKDKVLVADPASTIKYVSKAEFKSIYTGIVISFDNHMDSKVIINRRLAIKTIVLTAILAFLTVVSSYIYTNVLKDAFSAKSTGKVLIILLFFLMTSFIKELISFVRSRVALKFELSVDKKITLPVLRKLINLPHNFYYKNGSGDLISKVNDLSYVKEMIYVATESLFINVVLIIGVLISFIIINPRLVLINFVYIILFYTINKIVSNRYFYDTYELQSKNELLNAQIGDCINGITTIKNLNKEKYFSRLLKNSYKDLLNKYSEITKKYQRKDFILSVYVMIFNIIIFLFLVFNNVLIYDAIFIFMLEEIITNSVVETFKTQILYENFKSSLKRLEPVNIEQEVSQGSKVIINNISLRNISYGYNDKKLFSNASFNIDKGDFVLVNGKTGSGKSTLFKMLNGQISNYDGNICINGIDINDFKTEDIINSITYVDQKTKLFSRSIKENIYFGTSEINGKVEKFLKNEKINKNVMVDNISSNISGGQMQKVIIAQALANGGNIIIFDETTNQIDTIAERRILNFIKREYDEKIIILISHRKSNTDLFNKVISFENGLVKIKEKGG